MAASAAARASGVRASSARRVLGCMGILLIRTWVQAIRSKSIEFDPDTAFPVPHNRPQPGVLHRVAPFPAAALCVGPSSRSRHRRAGTIFSNKAVAVSLEVVRAAD
jgi:hypothetical protein